MYPVHGINWLIYTLAQMGGGDADFSPLTQFGLVGAILSVTFAFVWYVISGYRKDNEELKADIKDLNGYFRERVIPLVEACASALKETSSSNAEIAKALATVTFILNERHRGS